MTKNKNCKMIEPFTQGFPFEKWDFRHQMRIENIFSELFVYGKLWK